jgi:DNA-directed RNA polymerase specialized sigma24 family protein
MTENTESVHHTNHAELVDRIQAGDTAATEELYGALRAFRPFLCRTLGPTEAEDAAQDVFLIVYQAAVKQGGIRDARALMGYAKTVVHRQVAGRIPGIMHTRRCCVNADDVALRDPAPGPEQMASTKELLGIARRLVATMQPREREILCRVMQDEPNGRIIRKMGFHYEAQFRNDKHHAKSQLTDRFARVTLMSKCSTAQKVLQ